MKEIKLTQGKIAIVDDDDYEYLSQFKWTASENGSRWYAKRSIGPRKKVVRYYMHRELMHVTDPKVIVDHIDRDPLNNQKVNLRLCSKQQNNQNRIPVINSKSKYMGVCPSSARWGQKRWRGYINPETGQISKLFYTEIEAAKWYNDMAKKHFGEFAYRNNV